MRGAVAFLVVGLVCLAAGAVLRALGDDRREYDNDAKTRFDKYADRWATDFFAEAASLLPVSGVAFILLAVVLFVAAVRGG